MNKESINEIIDELVKINRKTVSMVNRKNEEINLIKDKYDMLLKKTREEFENELEKEKNEIREKIINEGEEESSRIINLCNNNQKEIYSIYEEQKENLLEKVYKKILS